MSDILPIRPGVVVDPTPPEKATPAPSFSPFDFLVMAFVLMFVGGALVVFVEIVKAVAIQFEALRGAIGDLGTGLLVMAVAAAGCCVAIQIAKRRLH